MQKDLTVSRLDRQNILNNDLALEELQGLIEIQSIPWESKIYVTKELGISRTALFNKVKLLTGYSLNEHIKRQRIEKAIKLLNETDLSINEISDEAGFSYPRYFSSLFKELTGYTPTAFRKLNIKS